MKICIQVLGQKMLILPEIHTHLFIHPIFELILASDSILGVVEEMMHTLKTFIIQSFVIETGRESLSPTTASLRSAWKKYGSRESLPPNKLPQPKVSFEISHSILHHQELTWESDGPGLNPKSPLSQHVTKPQGQLPPGYSNTLSCKHGLFEANRMLKTVPDAQQVLSKCQFPCTFPLYLPL